MNENTEKSGNRGLVVTLVILCLMIVGLGIGVYYFQEKNAKVLGLRDCEEKIEEEKRNMENDIRLNALNEGNYEKIVSVISLYDTCISLADEADSIGLRANRSSWVYINDIEKKFSDITINDAILVDNYNKSVDSAMNIVNYARYYGLDDLASRYGRILADRVEVEGEQYYGGGGAG